MPSVLELRCDFHLQKYVLAEEETEVVCVAGDVKPWGVRKHSVQCVTWPHSRLTRVPALAALGLKPVVSLSPGCVGGFAQEGCWRQQGDLFPQNCDTEAQQQVPGPGCLLPCSQSQAPAQTCHQWSHREGNTSGDTMVRGMWGHRAHGDREGHGRGKAAGSAVVISRFCHGTLISHTT